MNVLLSIKPRYANQILDGTKKVEFRKSIFKNKVNRVYIYSSSPEMRLTGYFTIKTIDKDAPKALWEKYNKVGGIEKNSFFDYYSSKSEGYSILIDKVVKFDKPKNPKDLDPSFRAPQSFCYWDKISV